MRASRPVFSASSRSESEIFPSIDAWMTLPGSRNELTYCECDRTRYAQTPAAIRPTRITAPTIDQLNRLFPFVVVTVCSFRPRPRLIQEIADVEVGEETVQRAARSGFGVERLEI